MKFLGLAILLIGNPLNEIEDDMILDQSINIVNQDHILLILHPDREEEDLKIKERDIAEAQEEIKGKKKDQKKKF